MAKRAFAGSPPPQGASASKAAKKARPSGAGRGSSPPHHHHHNFGLGAGSTPRSRSRSRSQSAAPTPDYDYAYDQDGQAYGGQDQDGSENDNDNGEGEEEEDEEEEEAGASEDDDDGDEYAGMARDNAEMKEKLRVLLANFDEDQMDRYEAYRRSGLAKASVRKLVNQVLGQSVSPTILTVVRGFSKVFVGEIVEKARSIAHHPGPLTPADVREAYRLYQLEHQGSRGSTTTKRKLFVK